MRDGSSCALVALRDHGAEGDARRDLRGVQRRRVGDRSGRDRAPLPDPSDREVVAFLASALAFGRVASVLASIERVLAAMGPSPAAFVRGFDAARDGDVLRPLVHRWTRGPDLVALAARAAIDAAARTGSLERAFAAGHDPAERRHSRRRSRPSRACACRTDVREAYGRRMPARPGFWYFFTKPSGGSALQAAQPVPALDGALRRRRSRRLDAR